MINNFPFRQDGFEELPSTQRIHDSNNRLHYLSAWDVSTYSHSFVSADIKDRNFLAQCAPESTVRNGDDRVFD